MKTTVAHVSTATGAADEIRIDRRTRWGNPYIMKCEADRPLVIAEYRRWLWHQIKTGSVTKVDLLALRGKRLLCHCAPKACHGDVLAAAAEWAASDSQF